MSQQFEGASLPTGIELLNYGGDLVLFGKGLDIERYQVIKRSLPEEIGSRLIGFRSTMN
jgi:hypothetical protein